ncbi:MAG TPA: DNA-3-methyladenine glycosylase [Chthoniobacteraceae bacterium]|nr:DNA-3-methyladenine glycosylase [Chthoniobacteraceae bacterium]
MNQFLDRDFFRRDPLLCARELIGCELLWNDAAGRIVEVEAYTEEGDEACHTFHRPSTRKFIADHEPGAAYVYMNYGVHWLLNVLVKGGPRNGFVLFRALEPTLGLRLMEERRIAAAKSPILFSQRALCSGPGKLTQALAVDGSDHGRDLCAGGGVGFLPAAAPVRVVADVRIGISKAAHLPWRFLAKGSAFVSVPPRGNKKARRG